VGHHKVGYERSCAAVVVVVIVVVAVVVVVMIITSITIMINVIVVVATITFITTYYNHHRRHYSPCATTATITFGIIHLVQVADERHTLPRRLWWRQVGYSWWWL
jgi:hypothetical protein